MIVSPDFNLVAMCNWIGISVDMKTLQILPNINTKKDGILCTLNVNLQTTESVMWLKKKLKSYSPSSHP